MAHSPPLLYKRRPVIRWGQSNIAGGYPAATTYPARLQSPQLCVPKCHNLVCYGPATPTPVNAPSLDATWKPVQPFRVTAGDMVGQDVGNWGIDLADGLLGVGINAALIDYCVGGTTLEYWTQGASGTQYPAIVAWCQARLAELSNPLAPIVVFYQGESSSVGDYATELPLFAAGVRAAFGAGTWLVNVTLPASYVAGASVAAVQTAYVDALCKKAYCHDSTFVATAPADLHIDTVSGRKLAVGPDVTNVTRSVLTCIKEIIATGY